MKRDDAGINKMGIRQLLLDKKLVNIEDIVNNIKIGFNFIPGIGVGFCSNEKDLEAMKNFVRGGMAIQKMIEGMFGFSSTLDSSHHM